MYLSGRQSEILDLAKAEGGSSSRSWRTRFAVTPQTIRKDLNDLCDARLLNAHPRRRRLPVAATRT